ncbi:hypothetical protein BGZ97_000318 [Linnemannia gamsii]|jgi:hypothetical protein|uniref:Uncharacterized protein n=1 Tax=Linnemannia gamsii TaxID=64522 RepID=A0A9P6R2N8_9FUNG|nr:hypothetical protein BGZ97_000318 [Linnemannia gamsii]
MPAATFNIERTVGSQLPASRASQGFQAAIIEESQDPRRVAPHVTANGAPFDDGSAQANFDNFMMGIALDQTVGDLSRFSQASQGNNGNIPATAASTATGAATAAINQTQLLSGSRS